MRFDHVREFFGHADIVTTLFIYILEVSNPFSSAASGNNREWGGSVIFGRPRSIREGSIRTAELGRSPIIINDTVHTDTDTDNEDVPVIDEIPEGEHIGPGSILEMEAIQDDVDAAMDEIEDEIGKKAFNTHAVGRNS